MKRMDHPLTSEIRPSSPEADGFGTFETAFDSSSKPFASDISPALEESTWGSPWGGGAQDEEASDDAHVDEWEAARKQKEKLDKKIPPEVLADILAQCAEYCSEAWPESDKVPPEGDWMKSWRDGMDSIEGLETILQSVVPDLTLEPPVQFTKTSIAKSSATAIRLTKNLSLSKSSPMSHYLAARGSTAWENSVKERKVAEEDVVPVGWRILDKPAASSAPEPAKNTKGGGIFSFWSRRQSRITPTQVSTDGPREQSSSASSPTTDANAQSARASQDSAPSKSLAKDERVSSPLAEIPTSPTPVSTAATESPQPVQSSLYSEAPDLLADESKEAQPAPAPSAMSRFLNRFSRRRSQMGTSSSHSSFALSTDDLEFLSDVVPSVQDGYNDDEEDNKALAQMLKPEPLPPTLPPPPSAISIRSPSITSATLAPPLSSTPLIPAASSSVKPPSQSRELDGLDFFGAFETAPPAEADKLTPARAPSPANLFGNGRSSSTPQPEHPASAMPRPSMTARPASPPSLFGSLAPAKEPPSQALYMPPPPAPSSRSQTPSLVPATSSTTASVTSSPVSELEELPRPPSSNRKPKVPLSFTSLPPASAATLPSPPTTASSLMSTQSEVPLGELYPHAVARIQPPHSAYASQPSHPLQPPRSAKQPQPPQSAQPTHTSAPSLSAFILPPPPPPSSRPVTPSIPPPPGTISPPMLSPPTSSRPLLHAQVNHLSRAMDLYDDDEFSDFQSPTALLADYAPSAARMVQSRASAPAPFAFPPPPSNRKPPMSIHASLPPPSRSATIRASRPPAHQPQDSTASDVFDEFDSFISSSSSSGLRPSSTKSSGLGFSFGSDKSLLTPQKGSRSTHGGGTSSSALRTPSPPRPLPKSPRHTDQAKNAAPARAAPNKAAPAAADKKVKPSQHLRTLSLVEMAASTPGQWPAPPSPLPQALAAPNAAPKENVDLLGDESFGAFQSETMAPSASSPGLLNPSRTSTLLQPQSSQSFPTLSQPSGSGLGFSALQSSSTSSSTPIARLAENESSPKLTLLIVILLLLIVFCVLKKMLPRTARRVVLTASMPVQIRLALSARGSLRLPRHAPALAAQTPCASFHSSTRRQNEMPKSPFQTFVEVLKEELRKNRELQDNVKQLQGDVDKFQDSEAMKKARAAYERARLVSSIKENPRLRAAAEELHKAGVKVGDAVSEALRTMEESELMRAVYTSPPCLDSSD
ncbi:hypothetical protein NM688_g8403 [Phlebia brevispora]|uniref:Uncharacterized protein n=1 Tax=Phlebia brevispora TaxID=194682 RepID=A0ACC1RUH3_9APHY|nr:hypothetical protein NM688_g8403 [Phlebia brevispora]